MDEDQDDDDDGGGGDDDGGGGDGGGDDDDGGVVGQRRIQRANPAMAPIDICYGRSPPSRRRR